ncbi:MAG: hypothetical protein Q7K41_01110 [Dehalococcoidales bacterium]|nr:hypothetical protein [Dehalococcoidales bacterium]
MVQTTKEIRGGKRRLPLFQIVIFVAVLGLVVYGFSRYVLAPPESSTAPQYVGSLKLTSLVEGAEAQSQINQLHGTSISLENAFIAEYQPPYGGDHLMVWVGEAGSETAASDLISRMVAGIKRGGTPFSNPRQIQVAGHDIWQTDGTGGNFYFYISPAHANRVVWLSIEGKGGAAVLERAVKEF